LSFQVLIAAGGAGRERYQMDNVLNQRSLQSKHNSGVEKQEQTWWLRL